MKRFDRIVFDPDVMGGHPAIRSMPITVDRVVGLVRDGYDTTQIIELYPGLEEEDIRQALGYVEWRGGEKREENGVGGETERRGYRATESPLLAQRGEEELEDESDGGAALAGSLPENPLYAEMAEGEGGTPDEAEPFPPSTPLGGAGGALPTELDENDALAIVRGAFDDDAEELEREEIERRVARRLGLQESPSLREIVGTGLRAGLERGLLADGDGCYALVYGSIETMPTEEIRRALLAVVGNRTWERDEAIHATVRHLGMIEDPTALEVVTRAFVESVKEGSLERREGLIRAPLQ